jgi:hypothetical protein
MSLARWRLCLWLAPFLLLLTGCDRPVNRSAEGHIRRVMPDILGPAKKYDVRVDGSWERTVRGRLSKVAIDGYEVNLANGLVLDHLRLDLKDLKVDTKNKRVTDVGEVRFTVTVSKPNIDEYLAGETATNDNIRRARITLAANNSVTLSAEWDKLGIGVPYSLTGPVQVAGPRRIELDAKRLTIVGIPIWGPPLEFLKTKFEAGVDLSNLPFPVQLTEARTEPGKLILTGTADISLLLQRAEAEFKRIAEKSRTEYEPRGVQER